MAVMPKYINWMFDDEVAWKKALSDQRYNYMMPFENFIALYQEHRTGQVASFDTPQVSSASAKSSSPSSSSSSSGSSSSGSSDPSQILDQTEIDALIASMN